MTDYDELIRVHNEQVERDSELYSETLENMREMLLDEERVVDIFENADKAILDIDADFRKATGLNRTDVRFLMLATALQIARWIIVAIIKRAITEKAEATRIEHNDKSILEMEKNERKDFKEKHKNHKHTDSKKHRDWANIVFDGVPYDVTRNSGAFIVKDKVVVNMEGKYHRVHTLGHDPVLGWVFGTINILSDTITLDQTYFFSTFNVEMIRKPKQWTSVSSFPNALFDSVDSIKEDYLRLAAAVFAQGLHLKSDEYTKLGLPIPLLEVFNSDLAGKLYKDSYDALDFGKDFASFGLPVVSGLLAIIINMIISCIHGLFYDPQKHKSRDLYEVKTRKILSISNSIASASNIIWVGGNAWMGNEKAWADLDIGGILVTIYRLIVDIRFISRVQKDYLENEWLKVAAGKDYSFTLETDMSKKDIEKGIVIQAKADAAVHKKVAKGLAQQADSMEKIKENQQDLHNIVGVVLEDMRDAQAKEKYGIVPNKMPKALARNEKMALCAALFSLVDSEEEINDFQKQLFLSIENHMGIQNRQIGFDFSKLASIDSKADRRIVLEALCSFLFLKKNDFSFLDDEAYSWLQDPGVVNDIESVREIIEREFSKLGPEGIASRYPVEQQSLISDSKPEEPDETEDAIETQVVYEDETSSESFDELKGIILSFVKDEKAFGKRRTDAPGQVLKEVSKRYPKLAPETFVYASRVEDGYLLFTTHALYLRADPVPKNSYARIPYKNICVNELSWELGKNKGTRQLTIPVMLNGRNKIPFKIDDTKIEEEKLRDLIKAIAESKCAIADTDLSIDIPRLDTDTKILFFKALGNILLRSGYCLTELFLLVSENGLKERWNEIAEGFANDDALDSYVSDFLAGIPYPSQSSISHEALLVSLQTICRTNAIDGNPDSAITDEVEHLVCKFDPRGLDSNYFNKILGQAVDNRRIIDYESIEAVKDSLPKDSLFYDKITDGIPWLEIEARMANQEDAGMDDVIFGLKKDFEEFFDGLFGGDDE